MPTPRAMTLATVAGEITASLLNAMQANILTRWFMVTSTVFSSTGTSATENADGSVSCAGITAIILSNLHPSAAIYGTDKNAVRIWGAMATAGFVTIKQTAAGTPDSTASSYDLYGQAYTTAGAVAAISSVAQSTGWPFGGTGFGGPGTYIDLRVELAHANAAQQTTGVLQGRANDTGTTPGSAFPPITLGHRVQASFDGWQITFSQPFTGTIKSTTIR